MKQYIVQVWYHEPTNKLVITRKQKGVTEVLKMWGLTYIGVL